MNFLKGKIRDFYNTFICLKGDPRKIAIGMAIGVFVGITPTIPLHTILSTGIVLIFRQNLTAALLGNWISNPLTIPLLYFTEYEIGQHLLGMSQDKFIFNEFSFQEIMRAGWEIFYPLQLGGLILAPLFAVLAYFITHKAIIVIRKRGRHADRERTAEKI